MMLYANDSAMLCDGCDTKRLKNKTENEFYKIEELTKINKISLNYNQTKCFILIR